MTRAALVAVVAAAVFAMGCSDIDEAAEFRQLQQEVGDSNQVWEVVPLEDDDLIRVTVTGGGNRVELTRENGVWIPGEGATSTTAALMFEAEAVLAPMLAYRQLDVDRDDPAFGLVQSDLFLELSSETGTWRVNLGGETPSGYGIYATRSGDDAVYTVIPQVRDEARGLLIDEKIIRPQDPRLLEALEELADPEPLEEERNPWLAQVLEFEDAD